MEVKVIDKTGNVVRIEVIVEAEQATKDYRKVVNKAKNYIQVPGFRKGKAPLSLIQKNYGEVLKGQFMTEIEDDYYKQALDKISEDPVTQADVESSQWENGEEFKAVFKFEVMPELEEVDYENLEIEFTEKTLTEEMINKSLEEIQHNFGNLVETESIQKNDYVRFKAVKIDTKSKKPIEFEREIEVGENQFSPDLNFKLIGKKAGDEFRGQLFNQESEDNPELRKAEFEITILESKHLELPELNDDFAKDAGFDTLEALKADIVKNLEIDLKNENLKLRNNAITTQLIARNPLDIPKSVVHFQASEMLESQVPNATAEQKAQLIHYFSIVAEMQVKEYIILNALVKITDFQVTDAELDEQVDILATESQLEPEEYKKLYKEDLESDNFRKSIKITKIFDLIMETATIVEPKQPEEDQEETFIEEVSEQKED